MLNFFSYKIKKFINFYLITLCLIFFFFFFYASNIENILIFNINLFFDIFFLKNFIYIIYKILNLYLVESIILLNIFWILSFKIKMFFKEHFWVLKVYQKNELFFFKKILIVLMFSVIFNLIQLNYNFQYFSVSANIMVEVKNSILNFADKELFINNYATLGFKTILLFFFFFTFFMYYLDLNNNNNKPYKNIFIYFILLNFFLLFSLYFINCFDFFIFFILLIGINICTYSLLIFDDNNKNTREASVKYFISSSIGTLFILGGISLIFLIYKTTNFFVLHNIIVMNKTIILEEKLKIINKLVFFFLTITHENININFEEILNYNEFVLNYNNFIIVLFLLIGLTFKLALFPLHSWSIEIYSAIKYRLLSIFLLILKLIFFIKTIQIFFFVFQFNENSVYFLKTIIIFIAISSIIFSSFAALYEDKIKKIIAYSSINQLGFVFLSLSSIFNNKTNYWNFIESIQTSIFFIIIYLTSNLVLIWFLYKNSKKKEIIFIQELKNLPIIYIIPIFIAIISFSGLPPFAGFFSKFFVLFICWKNNMYVYAFIALLCSILSNYYYLKIIKISFFDNDNKTYTILKKNSNNFIKKKDEKENFITYIIYFIASFIFLFFIVFEKLIKVCFLLTINTIFLI